MHDETSFGDESVRCERCGVVTLARGISSHQRGLECEVAGSQLRARKRGLTYGAVPKSILDLFGVVPEPVKVFMSRRRRRARTRKNVEHQEWIPSRIQEMYTGLKEVANELKSDAYVLLYPNLAYLTKGALGYLRADRLVWVVMKRVAKEDPGLADAVLTVAKLGDARAPTGAEREQGLAYLEHYFAENIGEAKTTRGTCALCCEKDALIVARMQSSPLALVCAGCAMNRRLKTIALEV